MTNPTTVKVTVYGRPDCDVSAEHRRVLDDLGVDYEWVDISSSTADKPDDSTVNDPSIVFAVLDSPDGQDGQASQAGQDGRGGDAVTLTRPGTDHLTRTLERFGLAQRTIHHEITADGVGKYVLPLLGEDAFIDYVDNGGVRHITYSQVPSDRRGQGLGAELSRKTLDALIAEDRLATFGCGYVGAIADRYQPWQDFVAAQTS